jgi:excinuclease ABC subunit B
LAVEATGQSVERHEIEAVIAEFEHEMQVAARNLQFERAAALRDQIRRLRQRTVPAASVQG